MPPKGGYQWPKTLDEYLTLRAKACAKFEPLVANLQPWELDALAITAGAELKHLRASAQGEAFKAGVRTSGTAIGRRL